jgi:hypothetical protein
MLLHNFIVENRENDGEFFRNFNIRMDNVHAELTRATGEIPHPLATDNNEPTVGGRPRLDEEALRRNDIEIRERITARLATREMRRPMHSGMCS